MQTHNLQLQLRVPARIDQLCQSVGNTHVCICSGCSDGASSPVGLISDSQLVHVQVAESVSSAILIQFLHYRIQSL
jgi:hypothetical protein